MCGIAGFLDVPHTLGNDELRRFASAMADALRHRGPDDAGTWADEAAGIALGHRRLSVVDLSPQGHQPMASASGRYVVVFNGEVYNHAQLRARLDADERAPAWRGHSDTEVMLAAFERWGVAGALERFNGMFAFAAWDRASRTLHLARDRMGEKPLYYGTVGRRFAFGSELKALRSLPGFDNAVDREALALLLRFGYVPAPRSIHAGIHKLAPGTRAEVRVRDDGGPDVRTFPYWDLAALARKGERSPAIDGADALERLRHALEAAIRLQMVADVPVGAFLSGGVDSSLIVALMQRLSSAPVRTFTIGFHDDDFDEAPHARAIAAHLGTQHTEVYVSGEEALGIVPRLPEIYDEPFADSSQIPTCLVSRIAREHVTVCLSGDGGDELFAGYERHVRCAKLARMPAGARRVAGALLRQASPALVGAAVNTIVPENMRFSHAPEKIAKLGAVLGAEDRYRMYEQLLVQWRGEATPALQEGDRPLDDMLSRLRDEELSYESWMMLHDQRSYLPDDILTKVDRAAMAVSLETRVPLLDRNVVECAWSMPASLKLDGGRGKAILRSLLADLVPPALFERPKRGFVVPLAEWLRGPLRVWAESMLDERVLRGQGFLDPRRVRERWRRHLTGETDARTELWTVLAFQSWLAHAG